MKYIDYAIQLLTTGIILSLLILGTTQCASPLQKDKLVGIWLISEFHVSGYDQTSKINDPHQQWVELNADGTFRSGSFRVENHGVWKQRGNSNRIVLVGDNKDWCNSEWSVEALSQRLVFKGRKDVGNYLVNVILQRSEDLPIYKRYISKPQDKLIGYWKVNELLHEGEKVPNEGSWFRLRKSGEFAYGDASGELFTGNFLYHHPDSTLTFKKTGNKIVNQWSVKFEGYNNMVLKHSINEAEMHLALVEEFAQE